MPARRFLEEGWPRDTAWLYLDPPYDAVEEALDWVLYAQERLPFREGGGMVWECARKRILPADFPWGEGRIYAYGGTVLRVWRHG